MRLLVTTFIVEEALKELKEIFAEVEEVGMRSTGRVLSEEEISKALKGFDALLVEFDPVTQKVLEENPDLKLIASVRGGPHANIDIKAATERGIPVLYCPGRNGDTVADFAMGLLISLSRGIVKGHVSITEGLITDELSHDKNGFCVNDVNWVGQTPEKFAYLHYKGPTLSGKTLGLLGFGAIAREMATRATAFGMKVLAYDPYVQESDAARFNARLRDLEEVIQSADFLSIHLPVTPETRGLVGRKELQLLKPTAYLINTARAAVMDYDVLIELLSAGKIAGAALDVYPVEPLPPGHPLLSLENVILTPHIAGASLDPYQRSYKMLIEDIQRFTKGEKCQRVYNKEVYK